VLQALTRFRSWLAVQGPSLESVRERFLAVDLETTGLDPRRAAIVSLAAIPFVSRVPAPGYVTLVDPARAIPPRSTAVHGITDAMVRGAPPLEHVLREAESMFADAVLVGHNVAFDVAVLARARRARRLPRLRNHALDTARLAAALHPEWRDVSLERVAERLGVEVVARHTAEGDALTAGRIFVALLPEFEARRLRTVADLIWFQRHLLAR
jgi:DNA polymerase III epsilon subunit family exonuclease